MYMYIYMYVCNNGRIFISHREKKIFDKKKRKEKKRKQGKEKRSRNTFSLKTFRYNDIFVLN